MDNKEIIAATIAAAIYAKHPQKMGGGRLTTSGLQGQSPSIEAEIGLAVDIFRSVLNELNAVPEQV